MFPEPLKEKQEHLHIPYLYDIDTRILKSIALYGHNSYGKTNFIKAYDFFRNCIFNSFVFGKSEGYLDVDRFRLNTSSLNKPSYFELSFLIRETRYRYRFEILDGKVLTEDLWYAQSKIRENYLFIRADGETKLSKTWSKEAGQKVEQTLMFTKSHNLFLSVLLAQENIPHIEQIGAWLKGNIIISDISEDKHLAKAVLILAQAEYRSRIHKFIENADLGFTTIIEKIESLSSNKLGLEKNFINLLFANELQNYEIYTQHDVFDIDYKWVTHIQLELLKSESAGSIKYLILSCYLTFAIEQGQLIFVDEIDSKLHVLLLNHLIQVFNASKINSKGSQMIFTIHNISLLTDKVLRRDQILIVDKNSYGESSIVKMHTKQKPIRYDSPIDKKYLAGDLGTSKKLRNKNQLPDLGFS